MNSQPLVLHRRVKTIESTLHCRELELRLADDGQHVLLSRYVEWYDPRQPSLCATQHYRVPLASMIRWMINNGERGSAP